MNTGMKITLGLLASALLAGCGSKPTVVPPQTVERIHPLDREKMKELELDDGGVSVLRGRAERLLAYEFNDMNSLGGSMSITGSDSRFDNVVRDYKKNRI